MRRVAELGLERLTEKERETLRLLARGHDAKSTALRLGVSVHTVNERLRVARAKLSVTSSREAARLLLDREEAGRESLGPKDLGGAEPAGPAPIDGPADDRAAWSRPALVVSGVLLMLSILAAFAMLASPVQAPEDAAGPVTAAPDAAVVDAARDFLRLIDNARWAESYAATGDAFRKANTVEAWTAASEQARAGLGAAQSRELLSQDFVPAPPRGYANVKFRTRFANRAGVVETVTLAREGGAWRVAGIAID